jgi:hypothetical protein
VEAFVRPVRRRVLVAVTAATAPDVSRDAARAELLAALGESQRGSLGALGRAQVWLRSNGVRV